MASRSKKTTNGWEEWGKHVLSELNRINNFQSSCQGGIYKSLVELRVELEKSHDLLMNELKEHRRNISTKIDLVEQNTQNNNVEIGKLKVKSGIWGFAAGAIPTVLLLLYGFVHWLMSKL